MTHVPRTAAEIRAALLAAARAAGDASVAEQARWDVIRGMEQAWSDQPAKVRAANRRAVLGYLFGYTSTKLLADSYIVALAAHLEDFDAWAELRTVLREVEKEAGQMEITMSKTE